MTTIESAPPIEVHDLSRRFGAVHALDGVSFAVQAGELYGLVGPDGAGKTTTLRILAGLLPPTSGAARIAGRDPAGGDSGVREQLGYMPQRYALYGDLSVAENLRFFGELFCLEKTAFAARRERLLAITRLGPFTDRRAEALSGGMYKKLALACALLHEPKVLLLDEPTNGVDPVSRIELWELLYEFVAGGMAVIVSTPYMDEAARCHRVGFLHKGRLLLEGPPARLVAGFEDVVLRTHKSGESIEAALAERGAGVVGVAPFGTGLRIVVRRHACEAVEALLARLDAPAERIRPSFEDLFLARIESEAAAARPEGPRAP